MPDDNYPGHLVPKSNYLALDCGPFISQGRVLRCLKKPADFDPTGMITEKCFAFPQTADWIRGFSISLLGTFKVVDAAWQFSLKKDTELAKERASKFELPWLPGEKGLRPSKSDAEKPDSMNWGYFWMPLAKVHEEKFKVGDDIYTCYVVHRPTKRNYWHFELHFKDKDDQDLEDLYKANVLKSGKIRGIVTGIRAKLLSEIKVIDLEFQDWPTSWYSKEKWWQGVWRRIWRK
jgi:hypothetical protein